MQQQTTPQSNNNMDPYAYFKWKQQKYKSSRTNNGGGGIGGANPVAPTNGVNSGYCHFLGNSGPIIAN
jgi:hypothetical protein